jgi:hypothetical protein
MICRFQEKRVFLEKQASVLYLLRSKSLIFSYCIKRRKNKQWGAGMKKRKMSALLA